jgi:large exoprotein involved in heme utilization and adhesion
VPQENSDIIANANQGRGGNIQISTQLLTGLAFRPYETSLSDITASSQSGLNGNVQLNVANFQLNQNPVALPIGLIDPATQITPACSASNERNSFVVTGRGGLPPTPTEVLNAMAPWGAGAMAPQGDGAMGSGPSTAIIEAQALVTLPNGQMALVATPGAQRLPGALISCAAGQPR